jgi:hypothetical protein
MGYEPLKSQSKIQISSFVTPSKIFVWGAYNYYKDDSIAIRWSIVTVAVHMDHILLPMWETTFPRNTHAGFCKDFTTIASSR